MVLYKFLQRVANTIGIKPNKTKAHLIGLLSRNEHYKPCDSLIMNLITMTRIKYLITIVLLLILANASYGQDVPELHLGGALRFNYNYSTWKEGQKNRGGDFGYDVFYLDVNAKYKGLYLDGEYRVYSKSFGGGFLKRGFVGYDFSDHNNLQIGLTKVPFGIATNSHNWFFGLNYYLGFEDDYDMGIKYSHSDDHWDYAIAFFKNAEELDFGSNSDVSNSRYAYDIGSLSNQDGSLSYRNKEVNQGNVSTSYKFGADNWHHKIGLSAEYGGLYNLDTKKSGHHHAIALNYELDVNRWDFKAQVTNYGYHAVAPSGESKEVVAMTAYGAPYLVASKANLYTLASGYTLPLHLGPISSVVLYDDFGIMDKMHEGFANSYMNVTGAMFTAGPVITFLDIAAGKNHPWLGPDWTDGLGAGNPDANWSVRCNLNLGFYF